MLQHQAPLRMRDLDAALIRLSGFQRMAHPAPRVPGSSSACRLARAMSWRPLWDQNLPSNMRAAAHTSASESVPPEGSSLLASDTWKAIVTAVEQQAQKLTAFSGRFMPMVILFFLMAFVNTILDSLKDTLVITAVGGGAQVIPYLTVYAVLPSSLVFLFLYSAATQHLTRTALFNSIIAIFMAFFVLFAFVLYPNHHTIHPHGLADSLAMVLPSGLSGFIGMVRNWTFTLFFCMSELWGDVCLGVLFWGLANDTTSLSDAHTLYPLFGLGANVAQSLAGLVLKVFSGQGMTAASFESQIRTLMTIVLMFSAAALAMYAYIDRETTRTMEDDRRTRQEARRQQRRLDEAAEGPELGRISSGETASSSSSSSEDESMSNPPSAQPAKETQASLGEIFGVLVASVPIQCLAVMSLAMGLCSSLMEFAWKCHIKLLYPSPGDFTAFMGDVSTWQGVVTGALMVLSPTMFRTMGWKGVAATTPQILLVGGVGFFGTCMLYQYGFSNALASGGIPAAEATLAALVYGGAALYVFSKSAKFSLFKPAEEMVYISLDKEGRTKGKAAIDVVGSQAGKSGGSILQQVLLVLSSGAIASSLPIMFIVYSLMAQGWLQSVTKLSDHNPRYGHADSVHPTLTHSDDDDAPSA